MSRTSAHPVRALREHATAVEAAITVCLGEPNKRAVHELRRETRRIEAQVDLLKTVHGIPPFEKEAGRMLRQLKRVRRAAGAVRDLDVQRELIAALAKHLLTLRPPGGMTAEQRARLQAEAERLRRELKQERKHAAHNLIAVLDARQARTAASIEQLMQVLAPAAELRLSAADLQREVAESFRRRCRRVAREKGEVERLHGVRKAAKVARYQSESAATGSHRVTRAAKQYAQLQDAGGQWHDWLELSAFANKTLGKQHVFAGQVAARGQREDRSYRRLLAHTEAGKTCHL